MTILACYSCNEFSLPCVLLQEGGEDNDFHGVHIPTICPFGLPYYADWIVERKMPE